MSTYVATVECPRCHGNGTEQAEFTNREGYKTLVLVDCELCDGEQFVDRLVAAEFVRGLDG